MFFQHEVGNIDSMNDQQLLFLRRLFEMNNREKHPSNMWNVANSLGIDKPSLLLAVKPLMQASLIVNDGQDRFTVTDEGEKAIRNADWDSRRIERWILDILYQKYMQDSTLKVYFKQPRLDKETPYFGSQSDPPWTSFFREVKRLQWEKIVELDIGGNSNPYYISVSAGLTPEGYSKEMARSNGPRVPQPARRTLKKDDVFSAARTLIEENGQTTTKEVEELLRRNGFDAVQSSISEHMNALAQDSLLVWSDGPGYKIFSAIISNVESISTAEVPAISKQAVTEHESGKGNNMSDRGPQSREPADHIVGIFVALKEERDVLIKQLKFKSIDDSLLWTVSRNKVKFVLFSDDSMGRVQAAIATMNFLREYKPNMLIVAGIAGGFASEKVKPGDIIFARSVADLAMRKIREKEEGIHQQFRPKEFHTDLRLEKLSTSGHFNETKWQNQVVAKFDWPKGERPVLHYGTIACADEVVSSGEWASQLSDAWPKLLGIEMESGGVCAAASYFNIKPCVIRGVSDGADPAKTDTEWRLRSMKTVAYLIDTLLKDDRVFKL